MNNLSLTVAWILGAYLVGGIPFGCLIGKARGIDVRTVGSKNIGATNVFRTVGKKWGLAAFACDVLKGLLPTAFAPEPISLWVGVATVVGHMLTPYMKFRGGKGVATSFGMLIGLVPGVVGCECDGDEVRLSGSCTAALFLATVIWFPVLGTRGYADLPQCVLVTLVALFVVYKHRSNIARLAKGTENKIYLFGNKKA